MINLWEWLKTICSFNPIYVVIGGLILLFVIVAIVACIAVGTGNTFSFWIFKIEPNHKLRDLNQSFLDLKKEFNKLDLESKQKGQWLTLLSKISRDIIYIRREGIDPEQGFAKLLDYILPTIISILTADVADVIRAAIMIPEGDNLKIYKGFGYSVEGYDKLRLPINDSVAGHVYTSGKASYIKDVYEDSLWKANPHASKKYHTLFCLPITTFRSNHGVLNIDGESIDAFNKDDRNALRLIADTIGSMFYLNEVACMKKEKMMEEEDNHEKQRE